uniref:Uncharacterized protein n=1 Tax=Panagrolaimus davidi TaxID=227884 RepID=A0A914PUA2_9BILA
MNTDKTLLSTSETRQHSSKKEPHKFQQKKKNVVTSIKSMKEEKTQSSESTANESSNLEATTPPVPTPFSTIPEKLTKSALLKTPMTFSPNSIISPITTNNKDELPQKRRSFQPTESRELLKEIDKNLYQIEKDQSKQISWIRRLSKQKWFSFLDIILGGLTLLFFTTAFYFIFHINPTMEMKLTPEFIAKVRSSKNEINSFEKCQHSSWLKSDPQALSVIDTSRCFNSLEYGRVFFERFKATTSDSSNGCNTDRVEIHPCYTKTGSSDPMNILWGFNNTQFDYKCFGTTRPSDENLYFRGFLSFNYPVTKYSMFDEQSMELYLNRIVSSTAFFFQCPKCEFLSRSKSDDPGFSTYYVTETSPSIPRHTRKCGYNIDTSCDFNKNAFATSFKTSFSQKVLPFTIVNDTKFDC